MAAMFATLCWRAASHGQRSGYARGVRGLVIDTRGYGVSMRVNDEPGVARPLPHCYLASH